MRNRGAYQPFYFISRSGTWTWATSDASCLGPGPGGRSASQDSATRICGCRVERFLAFDVQAAPEAELARAFTTRPGGGRSSRLRGLLLLHAGFRIDLPQPGRVLPHDLLHVFRRNGSDA